MANLLSQGTTLYMASLGSPAGFEAIGQVISLTGPDGLIAGPFCK